jgi:NADH-quinone oxidoreductase subunit C
VTETDINYGKLAGFYNRFRDCIVDSSSFRGDLEFTVSAESLLNILAFLKEDPQCCFEILLDLFGMDYSSFPNARKRHADRFAVIYLLYSVVHGHRVRLRVCVAENSSKLRSATTLFPAANWFEREVWDMFGIEFLGHPDLKRILCHADFIGHPLRKDYPSDQLQRLRSSLPSGEL